MNSFVLKGTFLDTPAVGEIRCRTGTAVVVDGICLGVFDTLPAAYAALPVQDAGNKLVIPGLVDLHLHAPQYSYCGLAMDKQLLEWLEDYTFPEEARYADIAYARKAYSCFTEDLKHSATTRICAFATIHTDSTLLLMEMLEKAGLRGYVGKVAMNRNCPDTYREKDLAGALAETRRWLEAAKEFQKIKPIITPRFTPSVTDEYMEGLGRLAGEYALPVQSHLSENQAEIRWVKELCPDCDTYGETYSRYGLFGGERPTIMAHCIYCPEEEEKEILKQGVMIAHCPTSNSNVVAGIAPAARYLRRGYRIGLGSDVAGGHTLNLFEVMRYAIQVSKLKWLRENGEKPLTFAEAFYMATAGGGSFFADEEPVGLFEAGYAFDAAVLDDSRLRSPRLMTAEERLERWCYMGDGTCAAKYVQGEQIL